MPFEPRVAAAVLVYLAVALLPGLALLRVLRLWPTDPFVALGTASGVGLVAPALILLWARTIGVSIGSGFWLAYLIAAATVVAVGTYRERQAPEGGGEPVADEPASRRREPDTLRPHAVLGAILVLVLASRWAAAAALEAPMWGDSVHHAMIVRLFTLHGGLVDDWQPLAPLSTFSYHFGLHAAVTAMAQLTGLPAHRALLVAGQVLGVLGVLTSYALVAGLTGRPWAGVGAALAVAGLSPMPAYYLNWGRYTQLAGQVVLPAAALTTTWVMASARDVALGRVPSPQRAWLRAAALAAVLAGGLFLTHYLVAVFFALFLIAWWIVGGSTGESLAWRGRAVLRVALVAVGAVALVVPWLPSLTAGPLAGHAAQLATSTAVDGDVIGAVPPSYVWGNIGQHLGWGLVAAFVVSAVFGLLRRDRTVAIGVLWCGLLLLAAYPRLVGLPITGLLKDFTVVIGLYVPAGLVVGGALGQAFDLLTERGRKAVDAAAVAIVALAAWFAWSERDVVEPANVFVTAADTAAIAWIRDQTAADAVFLAASVPAYGDTIVVGEDAGWWLPLLADRGTTVPPATVGLERDDVGYRERMNGLTALWHDELDAPATIDALDAEGVTHAYVGVRAAASRLPGDRPGLAERLAASPRWRAVYDDGGVVIYERAGGASGDESEGGATDG